MKLKVKHKAGEATAAVGPVAEGNVASVSDQENAGRGRILRRETEPDGQGGWRHGWSQTTGCLLGQGKSVNLLGRDYCAVRAGCDQICVFKALCSDSVES